MFLTLRKYSRFDEILHVVRHGNSTDLIRKTIPLKEKMLYMYIKMKFRFKRFQPVGVLL